MKEIHYVKLCGILKSIIEDFTHIPHMDPVHEFVAYRHRTRYR
jgi:hypothetical protein